MIDDKNLPSLEDLDANIKRAKKTDSDSEGESNSALNPTRVSLELFSGVVVGTAMGFYLDKWLDTSPIFLIILFFFGVAAGALNIYKLLSKSESSDKVEKK